jgi:hypothetical protein
MVSWFAAIVDLFLVVKQMLLDLVGMLLGNITDLLSAFIGWIGILVGVLYDIEALLEKTITLLIS